MSISDIIRKRQISRLMHFTTGDGILGILASKALLPREQLEKDKHLEFILQLNAEVRKDTEWLNYVNLSIQNINDYYFRYSQGQHADVTWFVLELSPALLEDKGVVFTTTNNIYGGVKRGEGAEGLNNMYAPAVTHEKGTFRRYGKKSWAPTCIQAEVLYPDSLSLKYLKKIYARTEKEAVIPRAQLSTLGCNHLEVEVNPSIFRG